MKLTAAVLRISATDLSNYLSCPHLISLDLDAVRGMRPQPVWQDPDILVLQERGRLHEANYLAMLAASGNQVVDLREANETEAIDETLSAMQRGEQIIAQGALQKDYWFGRADVLKRVQTPSALGAWSYEVYDCKLARETKAATILQLALYSELLEASQGILPDRMHVVVPGDLFLIESHRVLDYAAYYRLVRGQLQNRLHPVNGVIPTYPHPRQKCEECRWWPECDGVRRRDDHLSLVAGITQAQQKQLRDWNVVTVAGLARLPIPLDRKPAHGARESYERAREQARVQVLGREKLRPVHELLPIVAGQGLTRLPTPSPGDLFFDLEGDPFVGLEGREYLFGYTTAGAELSYTARWALTPADERAAFEFFVDTVMAAWNSYPEMHVFHFTPYEASALKRLMGRYATREDEVDRMLRAGLLIDLHAIARQSVRASVEQYSLKQLEAFHNYVRGVPLDQARGALRLVEHTLELDRATSIADEIRQIIEGYNFDDCASTRSLRDWLEEQRRALLLAGQDIPRPVLSDGSAGDTLSERQARIAALVVQLSADIPADDAERTPEQSGRWLLANILDYHRREGKSNWWEYFRLKELPDEELYDEKAGVAGLAFVKRRFEGRGKLPIDSYTYPDQETDVRVEDDVHHAGQKVGTVVAMDPVRRLVDIKKTKATADLHPASVYSHRTVQADELADSLYRLASWVLAHGIDGPGPYRAERDLLLGLPPRRIVMTPLINEAEAILETAKGCARELQGGVLPIQGPPGSGKTHIAARVIVDLVRRGKKVGVTALSHAVVRHLLEEVVHAATEEHVPVALVQKVPAVSSSSPAGITEVTGNPQPIASLQSGQANVVGGTAWLWARNEYSNSVDVLVVDEAGQMPLANVLAAGQATTNIILLGDPQQLDHPTQGAHPAGTDASALAHVLGESETIPEDRGLFLPETWRLHPTICEFISEVFYEGRLAPHKGLDQQKIDGHDWIGPAGLWLVPVNHSGNTTSAQEEVDRIVQIIASLLQPDVSWTNQRGETRRMREEDILVVAPYNAQVADLSARLSVRVGTVDKFQGQEAALVIYSLTTSSPEDAPHGRDFLYSRNRLNVALSRARVAALIVGSPMLFEPECQTPRQIRLANALCRFREVAKTVRL